MSTAPAADDATLRVAFLDQVLDALHPQPDGPIVEYVVVPDRRRPRLLIPARPRRVAAAAVRHYAETQSRLARIKRRLVSVALRTGAARWLLPDRVRVNSAGSIQAHLADVLGEPVSMSVHIGPLRANRKIVLQVLRPTTGEAVGFAKLGSGTLTRTLVRAEAAALTTLAGCDLRGLTVPQVRHAGPWQGHELLVQSALPVWQRRARPDPARLAAAMREVAVCCGTTAGPLAGSPYWETLAQRVAAVTDRRDGVALAAAAQRLIEAAGETVLQYGAWHGDWTRWNMAVLPETLLVWDWERFTTGVPLGFDAIHFQLQREVHVAPDPATGVERILGRVDELLSPFDVAPAARTVTALLYLTELAARYLTDRQAEAGVRLGVLGTWLLPVLIRRLEGLR